MLHIYLVFNTCFKVGYYLYHFKKSITIVSCKINKDDYTKAKSYCPMVLLNTLSKVLDAILVKCLSYLATEYVLLFQIYISKRKSTYTNNAYYYLLEQVYIIWNIKKWLFYYYLM